MVFCEFYRFYRLLVHLRVLESVLECLSVLSYVIHVRAGVY